MHARTLYKNIAENTIYCLYYNKYSSPTALKTSYSSNWRNCFYKVMNSLVKSAPTYKALRCMYGEPLQCFVENSDERTDDTSDRGAIARLLWRQQVIAFMQNFSTPLSLLPLSTIMKLVNKNISNNSDVGRKRPMSLVNTALFQVYAIFELRQEFYLMHYKYMLFSFQ